MRPLHSDPFLIGALPQIAGRRILITGVNGFIGCHAAAAAIRSGAQVAGVDLKRTTDYGQRVRETLGGTKLKVYEVESFCAGELGHVFSEFRAEMIIHLAGSTKRENVPGAWLECFKSNVLSTSAVVSAIHGMDVSARPVLVMPGTQMEYGLAPMPWTEERTAMPDSPYGASKAAATELIRAAIRSKALRGCVVRFPLIFGPGQSPTMIVPELICKALRGSVFQMTEGLQQRRFLYVGDAVRFLLTVANSLCDGREMPSLINAPAYEPLPVIDIIRRLTAFLPKPVDLRVGALAKRHGELIQAWPDSSLAGSMNIILLTPLEKSLALTASWYVQNQWFVDAMSIGH